MAPAADGASGGASGGAMMMMVEPVAVLVEVKVVPVLVVLVAERWLVVILTKMESNREIFDEQRANYYLVLRVLRAVLCLRKRAAIICRDNATTGSACNGSDKLDRYRGRRLQCGYGCR